MNLYKLKRNSGFTLIELLVVISIIGFLSTIVLASLNSARLKARNVQRIEGLKQVQTALEMYYNDNNSYPNTSNVWQSQCSVGGSIAQNSYIPGLVPTYISSLPVDPTMVANSNFSCYAYRSNGTDYELVDYNVVDVGFVASPTASLSTYYQYPTFVDYWRNGNANNSVCTGATTNYAWKISSPGDVCF